MSGVSSPETVADETAWARLDQALTRLHAAGRHLTFWWRDDDAVAATPQLDHLLDLAQRHHLPVALAVVPGLAETSLVERLQRLSPDMSPDMPEVVVLQHGWKHQSHANTGAKNSEYPASRDPAVCLAELHQGKTRLATLFGPRFLPVLVPPWNRFADALIPRLAAQGFMGISGGPSGFPGSAKVADLIQVHAIIDPVDWASRRHPRPDTTKLRPLAAILDQIISAIEIALTPPTPGSKPLFLQTATPPLQTLGILTHHLIHETALWSFLDELFTRLTRHPAVRFVSARRLFGKG